MRGAKPNKHGWKRLGRWEFCFLTGMDSRDPYGRHKEVGVEVDGGFSG